MVRKRRILKLYGLVQVYCILLTILGLAYISLRFNTDELATAQAQKEQEPIATTEQQHKMEILTQAEHDDWTHVGNQVSIEASITSVNNSRPEGILC